MITTIVVAVIAVVAIAVARRNINRAGRNQK